MDHNKKNNLPNPVMFHTHSGMVTNLHPLEFSLSTPDKTEFLTQLEASLVSAQHRQRGSDHGFRKFLLLFNSPN